VVILSPTSTQKEKSMKNVTTLINITLKELTLPTIFYELSPTSTPKTKTDEKCDHIDQYYTERAYFTYYFL
jgi:hypothetical protein